MGYLRGKSSIMIFKDYGNLRCKFGNSNFLATLISLPSLEIYISFLPSHVATLLSLMRLFLFIISIVIFTLALFTHVVYITNEKRNIEEELRMADHANVELQHYISVA